MPIKPARPRSIWLATGLIVMGFLTIHELHRPEVVPPSAPLTAFPHTIGSWSGVDVPIPAHIVQAVGLDDYLNRIYREDRGNWVSLFITYYRTQRTGQTIHSPKNCLPGAGWQPVYSRPLVIPITGSRPLIVNEYDVVRDTHHVLVLYWYRERGREIASEYAARFWLMADAITKNRTDGALIRVTTPIQDNRTSAERLAVGFVRTIFPRLSRYIPN